MTNLNLTTYCHEPTAIARSWPNTKGQTSHLEIRRCNTREVHAEWEDLQLGRKVKGIGIVPKFSATPGKIWRGSAPLGYDNDSVYRHFLGMEELEQLRVRGII